MEKSPLVFETNLYTNSSTAADGGTIIAYD